MEEFRQWNVYESLYGALGSFGAYLRAAIVASITHNVQCGERRHMKTPGDVIEDVVPIVSRGRSGRRKTNEEMAMILGQWARMRNKANAKKRAAGVAV